MGKKKKGFNVPKEVTLIWRICQKQRNHLQTGLALTLNDKRRKKITQEWNDKGMVVLSFIQSRWRDDVPETQPKYSNFLMFALLFFFVGVKKSGNAQVHLK